MVNKETWADWDDEDRGGYGFDWTFTPVHPDNPEYRQLLSELQLRWLEQWHPYEGAWIQ